EGRRPVKTYWRYDNKRPEIYQFVKEQVAKGQQAYIVFPLVEESEKSDLLAATESYEKLSQEVFSGFKMALLHGRMKNEEKEAIMESFKNGQIQILVTTTVIEVGVDVPQATIMVVEHAERFGLTQLHQLRGRVGRGQDQAYCILIAQPPVTEEALTRLNTMIQTNDGFKIAEVDLKLRGPGEFFGTRQHGLPELKMANILEDTEILLKAREEAFRLVQEDPQLLADSHKNIRDHFVKNYRDKFGLLSVG
ncbi:MAG: helicase-related protein, partial [candidate division KSB1 bacterium]|nr:helicase-related protein [candidate division KSB1 bacterium]